MTDPSASSVVNSLLEEFGDNAPFALELYARYRLEPDSVEENWKRTFQGLEERVPHAMAGTEAFRSASVPLLPPAPAPARPAAPAARPGELVVAIAGGAIATSGDYERYFVVAGKRYCHILDPRTGMPVTAWQSVSVVAPLCVVAGSCSTIAMLLGNKSLAFLRRQQVEFLAIAGDGSIHGTAARGS